MTALRLGDSKPTVPFNARIPEDQKELIARAAAVRGMTLTDFVFQAARAEAIATIEREAIFRLSLAGLAQIEAALANPPIPTPQQRSV
jgi:uncharacterized protein (DUF1778 family)